MSKMTLESFVCKNFNCTPDVAVDVLINQLAKLVQRSNDADALDAELEETSDKLADVWIYLDSWARSEASCLKVVEETAAAILRKQNAPGWKTK